MLEWLSLSYFLKLYPRKQKIWHLRLAKRILFNEIWFLRCVIQKSSPIQNRIYFQFAVIVNLRKLGNQKGDGDFTYSKEKKLCLLCIYTDNLHTSLAKTEKLLIFLSSKLHIYFKFKVSNRRDHDYPKVLVCQWKKQIGFNSFKREFCWAIVILKLNAGILLN